MANKLFNLVIVTAPNYLDFSVYHIGIFDHQRKYSYSNVLAVGGPEACKSRYLPLYVQWVVDEMEIAAVRSDLKIDKFDFNIHIWTKWKYENQSQRSLPPRHPSGSDLGKPFSTKSDVFLHIV